MKYASRLNSFAARPERFWGTATYKPSPLELIKRASGVRGLSAIDLNFPDHFAGTKPEEIISVARDQGLTVNGIAMRYYSDPGFKLGAFTHPDRRLLNCSASTVRTLQKCPDRAVSAQNRA